MRTPDAEQPGAPLVVGVGDGTAVHAADDAEPAGAVAPLSHATHAVAAPPAEYVLAAHVRHACELR